MTAPRGCPDGGPEQTFRALGPKRLPGGPRRPPRDPKRPPRGPKMPPRSPKEGPRRPPKSAQRGPQAVSKLLPRGLNETYQDIPKLHYER